MLALREYNVVFSDRPHAAKAGCAARIRLILSAQERVFMAGAKTGAAGLSPAAAIRTFLAGKASDLAGSGYTFSADKELPYGAKIAFRKNGSIGMIDMYYSAKKGISFVDCSKNPVSSGIIALFGGKKPGMQDSLSKNENELRAWIGTDESGKGDFFGPLVIAGFFATRESEARLIDIGVCDSKMLSSERIGEIARILRSEFRDCFSVIAPSVRACNNLYAQMPNMNRILAWGHARAIQNLIDGEVGRAGKKVDGVVADQFGDEKYIRNALESMKDINLIQRAKAESNMAVAAASIIARDSFECLVKKMRAHYRIHFPFGAGNQVVPVAREFISAYGRDALSDVAKMHFKTVKDL